MTKPNKPKDLTYSVDSILDRVATINQTEVWKHIKLLVRVEGTVQNTKDTNYSGFTYFDLKGTEAKMSVKCPVKYQPEENSNIVFEGTIYFQVNRFNKSGIDVVINGKPVGQIKAINEDNKHIVIKKNQFIRLTDFFNTYALDDLYIIGSEIGIRDTLSHIRLEHNIKSKTISIASKNNLLKELNSLEQNISGIAIVRGGDDNETLSIWDEPKFVKEIVDLNIPFFVAIGHSHRKLYIEQYADDSFATPTALGEAITSVISKESQLKNQNKKLEKITTENIRIDQKYKNKCDEVQRLKGMNKSLSNKINDTQKTKIPTNEKEKSYPYKEWATIVILALIVYKLI